MENSHTNQKASNNQARRQLSRLIFVRILDLVHVSLFFMVLLCGTGYGVIEWAVVHGMLYFERVNKFRLKIGSSRVYSTQ